MINYYVATDRHPASAKGAAQDLIAYVIPDRHPASAKGAAQDLSVYVIPGLTRNPQNTARREKRHEQYRKYQCVKGQWSKWSRG
jgi:hypothetical protein